MNKTNDGDRFKRPKDDSSRTSGDESSVKASRSIDEINIQLQSVPRRLPPSDLDVGSAVARKHPAHGVYISPDKPTIVYVTVCCENRIPWLATERHHEILVDIWQDTSHWVVGQYILMPDHLHLFVAPQETAVEFDSWVQYFKSQFTKRNKQNECEWQTDHWDTRIRSALHYEEKSIYMANNPVRAGLVADAADWKYKGVVHELRWE